MLNNEE
jgi:hypothetical protein